jgi:hypothetical protein
VGGGAPVACGSSRAACVCVAAKKPRFSLLPPTDLGPGSIVRAWELLPRAGLVPRTGAFSVFAGVRGPVCDAGRLWLRLLLPALWRARRVQTRA